MGFALQMNGVMVSAVLGAMAWGWSMTAAAQTSGVASSGCSVLWNAQSDLDIRVPNYSNVNFNVVVGDGTSPPGWMQIQHFYNGVAVNQGASSPAGATMVWRIPVATQNAISNASVTVTLPTATNIGALNYVFDPGNVVPAGGGLTLVQWITRWGLPYAWGPVTTTPVNNGDGTWTIALGDMPANSGVIFSFTGGVPTGSNLNTAFSASMRLTGSYQVGSSTACTAAPVPVNHPLALLGLAALSALAAGWHLRRRS